jgi:hypothetical protein
MGVSGQSHDPVALYPPGKGPPGTHCIAGWVGLRAGLDTGARRKILNIRVQHKKFRTVTGFLYVGLQFRAAF